MIPYKFKKIFIDETAREDELTGVVMRHFHNLPVEIVEDEEGFIQKAAKLSLTEGKRYLWLTRQKSTFIKNCHGATNTNDTYNCCNYLVVNETTGCPIECSYCFLQGYMTNPTVTVYTNYQQINKELKFIAAKNPQRILRVGTGELSDSLALDPVLKLSHKLAPTVESIPNILLEFKTKTGHVDHLLRMPFRKMVVSWSVNPEWVIGNVEHKSAPLKERLSAMKKISDAGFLIGLHFDPVIYYQEWKEGYRELVRQIADAVDPSRIVWVSMGSFRTPPSLKENIRMRFPKAPVLNGEQIKGTDGKMRYIKPLRLSLYKSIYQWILQYLGDVFFYFCMDSKEMWREVLGVVPQSSLELDYYFAKSCFEKFPEYKFPEPVPDTYRKEIILMNSKEPNVLFDPMRINDKPKDFSE